MLEIVGRYATALVMTDRLDDTARAQIQTLCDLKFADKLKIRVMPDVHAGKGCTIGTTMTLRDAVIPNLVGVDIGCGMETTRLSEKRVELSQLDRVVRERVACGFQVRKTPHPLNDDIDLNALRCAKQVNIERGRLSLGTLGGGNHFIEMDEGEDGARYLVVHSGSRGLGLQVANYYQAQAARLQKEHNKRELRRLADERVKELTAQGRTGEIAEAILALSVPGGDTPDALCCLTGDWMDDYLYDMRLMQRFAQLNRQAITQDILRGMKLTKADGFTTIHNYIDMDNMILRKGAVSARAGERLLIPINMRDGSLLCEGLGNDEYNQSAPHGAGRLFGRREARERFTVSQFKKQMTNVFSTSVGASTLDECPMAYKSMDEIIQNIAPTALVRQIIRPIYNFKASDEAESE